MASLGSLYDSFTGDSQKRRADEANRQFNAYSQAGYNEGSGFVKDYNERGNAYLQPYATQGQGANKLYGTFLGLDGADAQRSAFQNYQGADPFRQYNEDMASRAAARQFNRLGMLDSGNFKSALAEQSLRRGSQDFGEYMQRLQGLGQQGMGAANSLAGYANNTGGMLGQMRMNLGQQQAGNAINYQNSLAAADGIFGNNLLKVAALAAAPFTGGASMMAFPKDAGMGSMGMGNNFSGGYGK